MNEPTLAMLAVPNAAEPIVALPSGVSAGLAAVTPIEILAVMKAIDRLDGAVAAETETLRSGGVAWFEDFNYRKSHGLLELTRAMRALRPEQADLDLLDRLSRLRVRLEGNRVLLKTHLDATREISEILTAALRNSDSDGTYSVAAGQRGRT